MKKDPSIESHRWSRGGKSRRCRSERSEAESDKSRISRLFLLTVTLVYSRGVLPLLKILGSSYRNTA